jgi:hypothetical protein
MFVMARVANANGASDVLWSPGKFGADAAPEQRTRALPDHTGQSD